MTLNKVMIIGHVVRDPEMRTTPNGANVANFSVATNLVWTDASGQRQDKSEFHNVVAWRRLAEICGQYLKKGAKVYIEGRLQTRDWVGQDGQKRYRTEIVADNMILLDRPNARPAAPGGYSAPQQATPGYGEPMAPQAGAGFQTEEATEDEIKVEDIPF
ncbi:MAG: single-stranded DNA-binding protein [Patescibacteria group bacterium]